MKKLFFSFLLAFASTLTSMPVLNIADPALLTKSLIFSFEDKCALKIGYRGDFVRNRMLSTSPDNKVFDRFQYYANQALMALTLWDQFDVYGFSGPYSYSQEGTAFNRFHIASDSLTKSLYGAGCKVIAFETTFSNDSTLYLGFDAQYQGTGKNKLKNSTLNGQPYKFADLGYYIREIQLACGVAYKIQQIVPYIAAKYSNARINPGSEKHVYIDDERIKIKSLTNPNHFGYVLGLTFVDEKKGSLTAEVRLVDENACSVSGFIRF